MGLENGFLEASASAFANRNDIPWKKFDSVRIVITGSTGLIGSQLVRVLMARNDFAHSRISLVLPVRNQEKAVSMFGERSEIQYIKWDLDSKLDLPDDCDYFVHAACSTSSKEFLNNPVETILSIINGVKNTLQASLQSRVHRYLFLSTMEVYGETTGTVFEEDFGKLDPMVVRNSYPEAKRLAECLCSSFYQEHSLETVVLRLAQTFGQGVSINDGRVFAEFGRHAISNEDIVLFSDGAKKNMYLSVNDAISAILIALAKAKPGDAYNVANEDTYCSVKEMAEMVLVRFGAEGTRVRRQFDEEREASFRKSSDLFMNCSKLRELGWVPSEDLFSIYSSMFKCWK